MPEHFTSEGLTRPSSPERDVLVTKAALLSETSGGSGDHFLPLVLRLR